MKKDNDIDMPKLDKNYLKNELTKLEKLKQNTNNLINNIKHTAILNLNELKSTLNNLNTKKKKKKHLFITIDIIIIIILMIFSFLTIENLFHKKEIKQTESNINKIVKITEVTTGEVVNEPNINNEPKENIYWKYLNYSMLDVNLEELKTINNEVSGWIQVNNTNVNYPYVLHNDNSYYLNHQLDKSYNTAGWVFMDYRNNPNTYLNKHTILYAHGLYNKALFGSLKNILDPKWYNNEENLVIKTVDETNSYLWQIFSIYKIENTNDYIQTDFIDEQDFNEFINLIKNRSIKDFNTTINNDDKILTLSTCYNHDVKLVIHAKLIKKTY